MTVSVAASTQAQNVATAAATTFTTATTLGHTPATGNLVVLILATNNSGTVTAPSGWNLDFTVASTTASPRTLRWYSRLIDGTEGSSYQWTYSSTTVSSGFFELNDSLGGVWHTDATGNGSNTGTGSSVASTGMGTSATLASSTSIAIGGVQNGATVSAQGITGGGTWTILTGSAAYWFGSLVTSATTALSPTASWTTSTTVADAGFQSYYVLPLVTKTLTAKQNVGANVNKTLTAKQNVGGKVTKTLTAKQNVDGPIAQGWKLAPQVAWTTNPLTRPADPGGWTTLTEGLKSLTIKRGTKILSAGIETGTATAVFDNSINRNLDPNYPGSAYYPNVVPRRRFRYVLQDAFGNTIKVLHTGFSESYQTSWVQDTATVTIPTQDLLGIIAGANLANSTYEIEARKRGATFYAPMTEDSSKGSASDIIGGQLGTYMGPVQAGAIVMGADTRNVPSFSRSSSVLAPDASLVFTPYTPPVHQFTYVVFFRWGISNTSDTSNPGLFMLEDSSPPYIPGGSAVTPKLMLPYLSPQPTAPGHHAIACQIQDGTHCVRLTAPVSNSLLDGSYHMLTWKVDGPGKAVRVRSDGFPFYLISDTGESGTTPIASIDVNGVIDAMQMFAVGWGPDWQTVATNPTGAAIGHATFFPSLLVDTDADALWAAATSAWNGDTTDVRLGRVCDWLGIDAGDRLFDVGTQTCGPTVLGSQNAQGYIKKIDATEAGECFVNGDGKLRFRARPSSPTPVATFSDDLTADPTGIPCEAIVVQNGWDRIVNTLKVTLENGSAQTVQDATSADAYGPLSGSVGGQIDTLHQTMTQAVATANFRINAFKNPTGYVPQIKVSSVDQNVPVSALVGIEVGDYVVVKATPPSPTVSRISVLAQVEYVQYDFPNPTEMTTTYSLGDAIAY